MFGSVVTSIISFISTNIDNIFVMMLLYAQVDGHFRKRYVVIGQYIGISILIAISLLGAFGLHFIPQKYIGLLSLIPIALGVKEWITYKIKKRKMSAKDATAEPKVEESDNEQTAPASEQGKLQPILLKIKVVATKAIRPEILSVTFVAVANGADNIGVYIPLFIGYSTGQIIVAIIIFSLMMALWCYLADKITNFPSVKAVIQKYRHIAVPIIFIALGVYIMLKSGLINVF